MIFTFSRFLAGKSFRSKAEVWQAVEGYTDACRAARHELVPYRFYWLPPNVNNNHVEPQLLIFRPKNMLRFLLGPFFSAVMAIFTISRSWPPPLRCGVQPRTSWSWVCPENLVMAETGLKSFALVEHEPYPSLSIYHIHPYPISVRIMVSSSDECGEQFVFLPTAFFSTKARFSR